MSNPFVLGVMKPLCSVIYSVLYSSGLFPGSESKLHGVRDSVCLVRVSILLIWLDAWHIAGAQETLVE